MIQKYGEARSDWMGLRSMVAGAFTPTLNS